MVITDSIKEIVYKCLDSMNRMSKGKYNIYKTEEIESFLKENNITLTQLYHLIDNNLTDFPKCIVCDKVIYYFWRNTSKCCSKKCALNTKESREKYRQTVLKKYGVENISQLQSIKEKKVETCRKNFGCDYPQQSSEVRKRGIKTIQDKYGAEYTSIAQISEYKEKTIQTNIERYGVPYAQSLESVKEKQRVTNLKKYGVEYTQQNKDVREKSKRTNNLKYGVDYPSQSKDIIKKIKSSLREYNYDAFINYLNKRHLIMLSSKEEFLSSEEVELKYKCLDCNEEFTSFSNTVNYVKCPNCSRFLFSIEEKELLNYIKEIYTGEIIENDRKILSPYELDIFIPDKNIAIEFNGNYWHSASIKTDKLIHQKKTLYCQEKGVRLIHIFEYEWYTKQKICKSIIKSALGLYDKVIYARKCQVKEILLNDYKEFLEENHLQGSTNSSIRYGLYYNDELVSVIGFSKSKQKNYEIELNRFCSKVNYKVIGGLSKLIKYSNINNFISYIDLTHFSGDGYFKMGFNKVKIIKPKYKWIKSNQVIMNNTTPKNSKLETILKNYDSNLTEHENLNLNYYYQVYDSGNIMVEYNGS